MKNIKFILAILLAAGLNSCKKSFLDETVNPNASSVNTLQLGLAGAEKAEADIVNGWGSGTGTNYLYAPYGVWMGYWNNPSGYIVNPLLIDYQITTTTGFSWTDLYENLTNLNLLKIQATTTSANANYAAIAEILTAYDYEQLVDNYNNVPYTQAFQIASGNLTPAYDTGQSIYTDLIAKLDASIALINKSTTVATPGTDDIIFSGNMTSWKKFANTIKLRLVMRQSNLSGFASLKTELATTASEGYLDGTTQAQAQPGYVLSDSYGGQESPFYREYGIDPNGANTLYGNLYYHANQYCVNLMNSLGDTLRLKEYYTPLDGVNASTVVGTVLGINPAANTSAIGPGLLNSSEPAVLLSGAESLFLQAEAADDGMISGTAGDLYNAGITASFAAVGLTADQAQTYYSQPSVSLASSTNHQLSIITQKYIALNGFGVEEAFNEYRRTGYPVIPGSVDGNTLASGPYQLPARIFYPQIEYSTNPVNVGKQPPATVATEFNSKIFWAK